MFTTDTRATSGIGALILLISMIIVGLIAAGVVIYMASHIREQIDQLPYLSVTVAYWVAVVPTVRRW